MLHGTKQLNIRSFLRSVTFLSPNKKVTKEVGLGGGAECLTPEAKAALPLRTLSRRALFRAFSLFLAGFCLIYLISHILYLISYILYLIITFMCYSVLQWRSMIDTKKCREGIQETAEPSSLTQRFQNVLVYAPSVGSAIWFSTVTGMSTNAPVPVKARISVVPGAIPSARKLASLPKVCCLMVTMVGSLE